MLAFLRRHGKIHKQDGEYEKANNLNRDADEVKYRKYRKTNRKMRIGEFMNDDGHTVGVM